MTATATGRGTFWTLDRVAAALAGETVWSSPAGQQPLDGVSTDTRSLRRGQLFVALRGENFDAHDFLSQALDAGAAALVVDRPDRARDAGVPVFHVRDTTRALGALGAYRRRAWNGPLVAIAGSNGKTTTKEFIRAALSTRLEVHATTGNLNNLVGVPMTLLSIPDHADVAVVELGTNAPGEIGRLREITTPDIAVVTCIGEEHLEGLGTLEGVLREESAVLDQVGVAVIPAGDAALEASARGAARSVLVAGLDQGDVRADSWSLDDHGRGRARIGDATIRVPLPGEHNLRNAMLAVAVARACGVDAAAAGFGIERATIPGMRSARLELGEAVLLHDAYNANPASMRAAIDLLSTSSGGRPRVAVLGTMREMGAHSERCHAEIAEYALRSSVEVIAGIGEMAAALDAAGVYDPRVITGADVPDIWPQLRPRLERNAIILVKASRGVKLERLVPLLEEWAGASARPGQD